jgi:acyl carrier protein
MNTFEKVAKLLAENRGIAKEEIKEETKFSDLQLDSLDMMDLVLIMEEEFSVSIELNEDITTVGKIADYIDSRLAK